MSTANIVFYITIVFVVISVAHIVYTKTKFSYLEDKKMNDGKGLSKKQILDIILGSMKTFITLTDKVIVGLSSSDLSTKEENMEKILKQLSPSLSDDERKLLSDIGDNHILIQVMLSWIQSHRTALDIEEKALKLNIIK